MTKCIFPLVLILFLFAACTPNNVTVDNSLKEYFDSAGVSGSFGLFDNGQGQFTIYNLAGYRDSAYLPASTFDIVSSLIGIQTGIVKDDSSFILWGRAKDDRTYGPGGTVYGVILKNAFQNSDERAFAALVSQMGKDTLKKWIDSLGYGNKNIEGFPDSFRINGNLRIRPDEQLGLLKKLYFDQLPFFQRTQRIVRGMMLMEANSNYQLSFKTGWGLAKDGHTIGWIMGWIEENKHPYLFVLNLGSADTRAGITGMQVTVLRNILKHMGFFEGKK